MSKQDEILTIDQFRRIYTVRALNRSDTIEGAAKLLGINQRTLYRWIGMYRIKRDPETGKYSVKPRNPMNNEKSIRDQSEKSPIPKKAHATGGC